jgi:hypothetical protein
MADDIVTRLRATGVIEPPLVTPEEAADEIERLRTTIKELHHHLGEALYSDEWNTREYAIAAHSRHEKELGNG